MQPDATVTADANAIVIAYDALELEYVALLEAMERNSVAREKLAPIVAEALKE